MEYVGDVVEQDGFQNVRSGIYCGKDVRLTSFPPRYCNLRKVYELVSEELHRARRTSHRNVSGLKDVVFAHGSLFLVHEAVSTGLGSLQQIVDGRGALEESLCRSLFRSLVSGLLSYHAAGFAHWDIQPKHLYFSENHTLKLVNMGVGAIKLKATNGVLQFVPSQLTCRAPELFDGDTNLTINEGRAADAWSCGVVLYYMVCGFLPFNDSRIVALRKRIMSTDDLFFMPWVNSELRSLVSALLQNDPAKRMQLSDVLRHPWMLAQKTELKGMSTRKENKLTRVLKKVKPCKLVAV
mmetsp:Transcript_11769/g.35887  ORF Transcript_11769/g.35887 Transcript_11769/m.35887 type:complete len:295 (-) Transcript_11769:69-953(-)